MCRAPALAALTLAVLLAPGCGGSRPVAPDPFAPSTFADLDVPGVDGLRVTATVPVGAGPFPVIVFSPGLGRSGNAYPFFADAWARRGFATLRISHPGTDIRLFRGVAFWNVRARARAAAADPEQWAARARDVQAVLDALPVLRAARPELAGLDPSRVGVAGHSYGAFTALTVAGMRARRPDGAPFTAPDPRPLAVVVLAPPGPGGPIPEDAWEAVERPVLVVAGGEDRQPDVTGERHPPEWRTEAWRRVPSGDAWLALIPGAHHFTFSDGGGGQRGADPDDLEAALRVTSAFWATTLGGRPPEATGLADLAVRR